jgi:hypothetical protein
MQMSHLPKIHETLNLFTKRCCDCGDEKPLEQFHYCARAPDRRQYRCIACRTTYDRQRSIVRDLKGLDVEESASVTRLIANWKPPIVVIFVNTSTQPGEASGS